MQLAIPDVLPVLSSGSHTDPRSGACFMEYVSLLAGEPWSDNPQCVENGLAKVMQTINDNACDANRHLLVPLLGRGIGLAPAPYPRVPPHEVMRKWSTVRRQAVQRSHADGLSRYNRQSQVLRAEVWKIFLAKVGSVPVPGSCEDIAGMFSMIVDHAWAIAHPVSFGAHQLDRSSDEWIELAVERATWLHEAYEEAMEKLGWHREVYTQKCSLPQVTTLLSYPELYDAETASFFANI